MKRICILILILCFLGSFTSCGAENYSQSSDSASESVESEISEESVSTDILDKTDALEGKTIKVLTAAFNSSYVTEIGDNAGNENCAEALRLAIVERTDAVEEAYGVEITEEIMIDSKRYNGTFLNRVRELVYAGTCEYDIIYPCLLDAATMASEGLLTDLSQASGIHTTNSWWDQTFIADTSILGTYYLTGDIGLRAKNAANCIFFNKKLFDDYHIDYPYVSVENKEWTLDSMYSIVKTVDLSEDTDGDGSITYHDLFGVAGQRGNLQALFYASGERIAKVGDDGLPYLSFYSERTSNVIEDALDMMQSKYFVTGDDYFSESSTPMTMLLNAFKADQCLFYMGSLEDALKLGDMESDFGILPYPMYDKNQEQYNTIAGAWSSNAYAVPTGIDDDRCYAACVILDALGSYSVDTVATAYYDVVLQYQKLRSEEDVEMLKIITKSIGSDLGNVYSIGGISSMLSELTTKPAGSLKSSYEALESSAQAKIDELIATFTK